MRPITTFAALFLLSTFVIFAQNKESDGMIKTQKDYRTPPSAEKKAVTFKEFGNTRVDNYFWLRDKKDPEVIKYLEAENVYAEEVMGHTKDLQNKLYEEMKGRIKEQDELGSLPRKRLLLLHKNRNRKTVRDFLQEKRKS